MSDLRELYQEVILDHSKTPRNYRTIAEANRKADGFNPLCGDKFTIYLVVEGGVVRDVSFQGAGCAISQASASMMTEMIKGKPIEEVEALFQSFHGMVTGTRNNGPQKAKAGSHPGGAGSAGGLGKLEAFSGVCEFPVRVKCATLAWHTLRAALEAKSDIISTE